MGHTKSASYVKKFDTWMDRQHKLQDEFNKFNLKYLGYGDKMKMKSILTANIFIKDDKILKSKKLKINDAEILLKHLNQDTINREDIINWIKS